MEGGIPRPACEGQVQGGLSIVTQDVVVERNLADIPNVRTSHIKTAFESPHPSISPGWYSKTRVTVAEVVVGHVAKPKSKRIRKGLGTINPRGNVADVRVVGDVTRIRTEG